MRALAERFIVLGVSGGIAAYKAAEVVRLLRKARAKVQVVMTEAAQRFVCPLTFEALSERPVLSDMFDLGNEAQMGHIRLAESADLLLIAPATADLIARMAAGMADDLLAAVALVTRAPMLLAPAMNVHMWEHPITQANVERLRMTRRLHVVGPGQGELACGDVGRGRMAEPEEIVTAAAALLEKKDLEGVRVLVTAGPTYEPIDPVRYLGNRSSGRMGYALAAAAAARGAATVLVSGPTSLHPPRGVHVECVETAVEMARAVQSHCDEESVDVVVMCAAVADFRPKEQASSKVKKEDVGSEWQLGLVRNPDILAVLGERKRAAGKGPLLVGFAAETDRVVEEGMRKLASKGCDLVVANQVGVEGQGFGAEANKVIVIGPHGRVEEIPLLPKEEVAHRIWDHIVGLLPCSRRGG